MKKEIDEDMIIPFRLEDMETVQWAVFSENYSDDNSIDTQIGFGFRFGIDPETKVVQCILKITLLQNNEIFLVLEVAFAFSIEKNIWTKMTSDQKITIPKGLKEHFLVISIGTIRGILYEKTHTSKSEIKKFVLPTLDIRDETGGDLVFDFAESE